MLKRYPKLVMVTVAALSLLAGSGWLISTVLGTSGQGPALIGKDTEITAERWCLACGRYRTVQIGALWQGLDRERLEAQLEREFPSARLLAFSSQRVEVLLPPGYCDECKALLPAQGYIGLADNKLAVFSPEGVLYKTYGEAPGAWLNELEQGIDFISPEDCLDWIVNLTS